MKRIAETTLEGNNRITVKPSTFDDVKFFDGELGETRNHSFKSVSFFLDNELCAIAGIMYNNGVFLVFSNIKEGVKLSKHSIYKGAALFMDLLSDIKAPLYCIKDRNAETSRAFLEKLGWSYFGDSDEGDVYRK